MRRLTKGTEYCGLNEGFSNIFFFFFFKKQPVDDEFLHLPGGAPARPPPARSVSLSGWAGSQFTARLMGETRQDRVG